MTYDELLNIPRYQLFDIVRLKSWKELLLEYPGNLNDTYRQYNSEVMIFGPCSIGQEVCERGEHLDLVITEITYDPDNPQDGIVYEVSYINQHNELELLDDSSYFTYEMFIAPKKIKSKTKNRKKIRKSMCDSTKFKKENV